MIVKHNLTAMNSNRMLGLTTSSQAQSTEKLSSGYKINRAADDAAGLAISEKMRKQIRGLTQASLNAQDGVSAVQTADGALHEVHDMIQRMTELSVKSANGTLSESDRDAIQLEVNQLVSEIDRVSTTSKFNETYLLRGASAGEPGKLTYSSAAQGLSPDFDNYGPINSSTGTMSVTQYTPNFAATGTIKGLSPAIANTTQYTGKAFGPIGSAPGTVYLLVEGTRAVGTFSKLSASEVAKDINSNPTGTPILKAFTGMDELTAALKAEYGDDIRNVSTFINSNKEIELKIETFADINDAIDLSLHVGADSDNENKIYMNLQNLSARGLGLNGLDVSGKTGAAATRAIDIVAEALQKVSAQRSSLGAIQNRLEHTINNLDNIVENTTAAESAIRDTDMATEMVRYSNNNILAQAGQSMLAQANQATQGVLSLLQ
jgi:flagellin